MSIWDSKLETIWNNVCPGYNIFFEMMSISFYIYIYIEREREREMIIDHKNNFVEMRICKMIAIALIKSRKAWI